MNEAQPPSASEYRGPYPDPVWRGPRAPNGAPLAVWGTRVLAQLLDNLIAVGALVGTLLIALSIVLIAPGFADSPSYGLVLAVPFVVGFVAFPAWNYSRQGVTGQTVGKRIMGIWVLRVTDGRPTGRFTAISRNLLVPMVAVVLTFGLAQVPIYLWPLWDPKRRSLMDIVFSTLVCHGPA